MIKYKEIESIVNFPQLPQKLVILYCKKVFDPKLGEGVQKSFQLTLNIPHYTKAAKIFIEIKGILKQLEFKKKLEKARALNTPGGRAVDTAFEQDLNIVNQDLFVQQDLRFVIQQIDPTVRKSTANSLQLIYASLQFSS